MSAPEDGEVWSVEGGECEEGGVWRGGCVEGEGEDGLTHIQKQ